MDIEIGDYVRTKRNGICRIDRIEENKPINKYRSFLGYEEGALIYRIIKTTEIVNHNKNIIELVEVGDFVNENKVIQIADGLVFVDKKYYDERTCEERHCVYKNNEIKTILTKEQYMNNCYVVKE